MLEAMRNLALDFLFRLEGGAGEIPADLNNWFVGIRRDRPQDLLGLLVEAGEKIERVYVLRPDPYDKDTVFLEVEDLTPDNAKKLPFVKPSGSQSSAIGPVIKRTFKSKEKLPGPSEKIVGTTVQSFRELAKSEKAWGQYFSDILSVLERHRLKFNDALLTIGEAGDYPTILQAAISVMNEKSTVYLTVADENGCLPGERHEYTQYLSEELANIKYVTQSTPIKDDQECPLCGATGVLLYPNSVKGAGINIGNADRVGAFPSIKSENAWKSYALCIDCADILYVYKNHMSKRFVTSIAGEKALLLPYTQTDIRLRQKFLKHIEEKYLPGIGDGVAEREEGLLRIIAEERAVTSLTIIWAKFGQNIEDFRGIITDVLPSRLASISKFNQQTRDWAHPVFPAYPIIWFDLSMTCLLSIFKRPGGKRSKQINASNRLFQLKRTLVAAAYHGQQIDKTQFWAEIMLTAKSYLTNIEKFDDPKVKLWYLLDEADTKGQKDPYLTMAGWIRHLALLVHYLKRLEVLPMGKYFYQPKLDALRPYFGSESGIDTEDKAFAFLLGILYGKVMQVQGARGVNVGANALTWLRRLTLSGKDLPELYVKVREKLLAYEIENKQAVRSVVEELGQLGTRLGSDINLDETNACYFLLLGQSMTKTVIPSKDKKNTKLVEGI